jgi:hypothetical protein
VFVDVELAGDLEVVEPGRVQAEDLLALVDRDGAVLALHVFRDLEVDELLDQPFRLPDGVVAAEQDAVLADPVEQLADDLREVPRAAVDERHGDREPAVDVGFLGGDPAEVLEPGQADVLDDEPQAGERGGGVVDVRDVEGVPVHRVHGRALVHVDVADAELFTLLQIPVRPGIGQLPSLGIALPLRGVDLDALELPAFVQPLQLLQAGLAVTRVEAAVDDEPARVAFGHLAVLFGGVEPVDVPVGQVRRLQDRQVVVPDLEQVVDHLLLGVALELGERPLVLLRREVRVVVVEALDEAFAVPVDLVRRAAVPEVGVAVDDVVAVAVLRVHAASYGTKIPRPWSRPASRSSIASFTAASG